MTASLKSGKRTGTSAKLPFVFLNAAITADGKLAPASRHFKAFGGKRDQEHLLELRATADAVMSGARTVDLAPVTMGTGGDKYRRLRLRRGLREYHLRIVVSGSGTLDPDAKLFKHRFSPIIVLTTASAPAANLRRLRRVADDVMICGRRQINFHDAFLRLREKWNVRRLLCEGGGEVNGALFTAGLVAEVHVTLCPVIFGGQHAPTLADGHGFSSLDKAARLRLVARERFGDGLFLVYRVT